MLEARLSDGEVVDLFSSALDSIVNGDGRLISQKDSQELYRFVSNYIKENGTVVTAANLKEQFDLKLTPVYTDYLFRRYHRSIDKHENLLQYGLVPLGAIALGYVAQLIGYENVSKAGFAVAFLSGIAWIGGIGLQDQLVRRSRRHAVADASSYISSLPVERFEYLFEQALEKYRPLFVQTEV